MPECKISIYDLYFREIIKLGYEVTTYYEVFVEDTEERMLCIIGMDIYTCKWKKYF